MNRMHEHLARAQLAEDRTRAERERAVRQAVLHARLQHQLHRAEQSARRARLALASL